MITPLDPIETYEYLWIYSIVDRQGDKQKDQILTIRENVETVYEKTVTPFGNSGKVDVAKKYIGKRVYVIVLKE